MAEVLEESLDGEAGKIFYCHPNKTGRWEAKAWRVSLELEGNWARKALTLNFTKVSEALRGRGYKEAPHWPSNFRGFSIRDEVIYVFDPTDGGLANGIIQLARDYHENPRTENIIHFWDNNMDTRAQQTFLRRMVREYVQIINSLTK